MLFPAPSHFCQQKIGESGFAVGFLVFFVVRFVGGDFRGEFFTFFVFGGVADLLKGYEIGWNFCIGGGDLERVDHKRCTFEFDVMTGEGADYFAEGYLDGSAVLQKWDLQLLLFIGGCNARVPSNSVDADVIIAVRPVLQCRRLAFAAVGLDMTAFLVHGCSSASLMGWLKPCPFRFLGMTKGGFRRPGLFHLPLSLFYQAEWFHYAKLVRSLSRLLA